MNMPDWSEVGAALGALAVVLVPLLLARWLILRRKDGGGDPHGPPPTGPTDAAPPRARHVHSSRTRTRS